MKGKKNRKQIREPSPRRSLGNKQGNNLLKVKFDVLGNDISCFISKNKSSKHVSRKVGVIVPLAQKQIQLNKNEEGKKQIVKIEKKENKDRNSSPDLIRQSSNTILSKIQEKGIRFDWKECQQVVQLINDVQQNDDSQNIWNAFDNSFQKSFASTNDMPMYQTSQIYWDNTTLLQSISIQNPYKIQSQLICRDWRTTIMIRNIPNKYSVSELAAEIDTEHADTYDFLYLPCDLKNQCNVGYGFINFINTEHLHSFYLKFNQYVWKRYRSQKICSLTYARLQGLNQLIQHFYNSKVLNQKQKKYRPIIKYDQIQKMVLEQQKK